MGDQRVPSWLDRLAAAMHEKDRATVEHDHAVRVTATDQLLTHVMERMEGELAPVVRDLLGHLLDNPDLPDGLRATLERGTAPTHQVDFIVNWALTVVALFMGAGQLAPPMLQAPLNAEWRNHQYLPLDPAAAATLVLKGAWTVGEGAAEAANSGLDETRFAALVEGLGDPPGPEQLLELLRRQKITPGRYVEGIRQGRMRVDWAADYEALMHQNPGAAMVMSGAVASQLDLGEARRLWAEAGMTPESFDWVYNTTGPPPPTEQLIELWRRGDITEAEVHEALLEGPLKIKWIPTVMKMKRRVPPMEQTIAMVRRGVLSPAAGTTALLNLGYDPDVVKAFIGYAQQAPGTHEHTITAGLVRTAYRDGMLSRAQAQAHLVDLAYSAADATFMLDIEDAAEAHQLTAQGITRVRAQYVAGHLDRTEAGTDLDRLHVQAAKRDAMLAVWDVERATPTHQLTQAQLAQAFKRDFIGENEYRKRLSALGYADADVDLLVSLAIGHLSVAQQQKALHRGDISEAQFRQRMTAYNLQTADVDLLVAAALGAPPDGVTA